MSEQIVKLLNQHCRTVNQLSYFEKIKYSHYLYKTFLRIINNYPKKKIGFIYPNFDDLDTYAIMDECLKLGHDVYYGYLKNKNIVFQKISNILGSFHYENGIIVYDNLPKIDNYHHLDILVFPVQIFNSQTGIMSRDEIAKIINNFHGEKIGYGYEFGYVSQPPKINNYLIKAHRIINVIKE